MKHHFADFLDREGNYWSIVPNAERFSHTINTKVTDKTVVKIATIEKSEKLWEQIFEYPNLEELTLHEPGKEQMMTTTRLPQLKRLRISHARPDTIAFISELSNLEEIVFEYVSGFSDLSPLSQLQKLKSLHFENLRRVSDFSGLDSLRYLYINGTLDWNRPIENFCFLKGLPNLEVFSLVWVINKSEYPAFIPMLDLKKLKKINIVRDTFPTKEFAFLEAAFPNVKGASWELFWEYEEWISFLGKRAGRIKCNNPDLKEMCNDFSQQYEEMKKEAEIMIKHHRNS